MAALDHEGGLFATLQRVGAPKAVSVHEKDLSASDSTEVVEDVDTGKSEPVKLVVPAAPATVTLQNLFRHPDAHPIVLDLVMLRKYGPDWLAWDPESAEIHISHDFPGGNVSDLNLAKLNACKALHLVDSFWQRWEVFTWCAMPFNGVFPDFRTMQVPTAAQMLVAVDIANRIREDSAWSDEMQAFMKTVYKHDGLLVPLPPADFFHIDQDHVDVKEADEKWAVVRASGKAPGGDTVLDEQLRRMLVLHQYLEESRARLHQQMELLHV
jgi:hypothetical protein